MSARVLLTGGTGKTGRRIGERLRAAGFEVVAGSRRPAGPGSVRFDWLDPSTHEAALAGVERVYLVAPAMVEDPSGVMNALVDRAIARGARRFVLLSSSAIDENGPGLGAVERHLREVAPGWTVLRPSWFMQNVLDEPNPHAASVARDGTIVTSTGDGRIGFIDVDDIAAVGARALGDPEAHNTAHVLTGPAALSYDDVAAELSRQTGRAVRHVKVSDEEARGRLERAGMPAAYAALLVRLDEGIRGGAEDRVTDAVERVTGRAPRSFAAVVAEWVKQHAGA